MDTWQQQRDLRDVGISVGNVNTEAAEGTEDGIGLCGQCGVA